MKERKCGGKKFWIRHFLNIDPEVGIRKTVECKNREM
jgi:hypothetical protein